MANNLRCLTTHQPWTSSIAIGPNRIINRTDPPPSSLIGNLLGIHAGKRVDGDGLVACKELGFEIDPDDMPISAVIAVARIVGWVAFKAGHHLRRQRESDPFGPETIRRDAWFNQCPENVGWVLSDVVALPEPVPCRGMQGVWWADQAIVAKVFEQLEAAKVVAHG